MSAGLYDTLKALHILAFTAWMAGMFYLPRLFVYHTQTELGDATDRMFQVMEGKLLRFIMGPAAITTWALGLAMAHEIVIIYSGVPLWLYVKFCAVVLMTATHLACIRYARRFAAGRNEKSERFFRIFNEAPTLLLVIIVFSVIFRPEFG